MVRGVSASFIPKDTAISLPKSNPSNRKNADGSLTIYIQKESPDKDKEANWLPAPDGTIYTAMRLHSPKDTPPSILPLGKGL